MKASSTINAKQPWCVILAGPNGSGKTTFYDQILKNDPMFQKATFINSDLIGKDLARISGKTDSNEFIIHAGRIALNLINHKIYKQDSFIYETTSSGKNASYFTSSTVMSPIAFRRMLSGFKKSTLPRPVRIFRSRVIRTLPGV